MRFPRPSLSRRVTLAFIVGNATAMLIFLLAAYPFALEDYDEPIGPEVVILIAKEGISSNEGGIVFRDGGRAAEFARRHPNMWFVARAQDSRIHYGSVPEQVPSLLQRVPASIREARFRSFGALGQSVR